MLRKFLILITFLALPSLALAQDLPQPLSDTVIDYDDILPAMDEARLSDLLRQARKDTGVHVVLVTMNRREDHAGQGRSIEDYAKALFNRWGVGDAGRNDGVMLLFSMADREVRVQLGSGYGSEWDGVAFGLIQEDILPHLRQGETVTGIEAGTNAVIAKIARPFSHGEAAPSPGSTGEESSTFDDIIALVLFGVMLLIGFGGMVIRFIKDQMVRLKPCPSCSRVGGLRLMRQVQQQATTSEEGYGLAITHCRYCNYHKEDSFVLPKREERDRDSDSGGYGGGQSSGGGATGRW